MLPPQERTLIYRATDYYGRQREQRREYGRDHQQEVSLSLSRILQQTAANCTSTRCAPATTPSAVHSCTREWWMSAHSTLMKCRSVSGDGRYPSSGLRASFAVGARGAAC
jgi:hypothetical protein